MKRVVLFLLTNLAVLLVLGVVVNLLGLNPFISRSGLNLPVLFGFALVFGMGGSFTRCGCRSGWPRHRRAPR